MKLLLDGKTFGLNMISKFKTEVQIFVRTLPLENAGIQTAKNICAMYKYNGLTSNFIKAFLFTRV